MVGRPFAGLAGWPRPVALEIGLAGASASVKSAIAPDAALVRKTPRKPNGPTTSAPMAGPMAQASDQLARRTPMARLVV